MSEEKKPKVDLSNVDGNVFAILGLCSRKARMAGKSKEWIDEFMKEAESGDYDHALQTVMKWFDVEYVGE